MRISLWRRAGSENEQGPSGLARYRKRIRLAEQGPDLYYREHRIVPQGLAQKILFMETIGRP
jgi:hypothetical protein